MPNDKALEAALEVPVAGGRTAYLRAAITAYLSALLPEDAAGIVERLLTGAGGGSHWMELYRDAASLIQSQAARIAELEAVAADLATDLEAELNARYGMDPVYPTEARRKERDMEPVQRARRLLNGERKG